MILLRLQLFSHLFEELLQLSKHIAENRQHNADHFNNLWTKRRNIDRKSTRLNSSHALFPDLSRMPSSA